VRIIDPERVVELVYIDDVVKTFLANIKDKLENGVYYNNVTPVFKVTVKRIVEIIKGFKNTRSDLTIPDFSDPFIKRLYATYLSYLPQDKFAYQPEIKIDNRGILAELLKSQASGQIFVSRTKPGITRGNHFHNTKVEKFCVLDGQAIIRFRDVSGKDVIEYQVSGEQITIVDIPPGYTHSIENIGQKELIVLFWANEIFDPENPDTYRLEVINEEN
jgi:UDP-2-acetamido-2,6-beta-L-arabino-hexul-4-ose reductase